MADITSVRAKIQEAHDEASRLASMPTTDETIAQLTAERDAAVAALAAMTMARDALQAKIDTAKAALA